MTDFPQSPPPPPPPAQRNGCITALMIVVGAILLLPGICGVIIAGLDPHELMVDPITLFAVLGLIAIGIGGGVLIWFALRRPRSQT
jgi:drug/metabolite transporter (DMT)-like permease